MNVNDSTKVSALIDEIIKSPGEYIPDDLRESLIEQLSETSVICPTDGDDMILMKIGMNSFIPACLDADDYMMLFKSDTPREMEFGELSQYLKGPIGGIIINPASLGFILDPDMSWIVFNRSADKKKPQVRRGYDVKVRLNDMRPLHWRDLIIPENMTFYELDDALKTLWGFNGHHLSMFFVKNTDIRIMDSTVSEGCIIDDYLDSRTTTVDDIFNDYRKVTYWYDFGDDWQFDIEIKKSVVYDKKYITIKRFKGKYNLIEDCRGVYGFSEIIMFKEHPGEEDEEYFAEMVEYLEKFDMDFTQKLLKDKDYTRRMYE